MEAVSKIAAAAEPGVVMGFIDAALKMISSISLVAAVALALLGVFFIIYHADTKDIAVCMAIAFSLFAVSWVTRTCNFLISVFVIIVCRFLTKELWAGLASSLARMSRKIGGDGEPADTGNEIPGKGENMNHFEKIFQDKNASDIVKTGIAAVFAAVLIVGAFFGSFYTLSETESAIVTTFGTATVNTNKGLQFKIPFIQNIQKVDTTVKGMEIGYRELKRDQYQNVENESIMVTSDMNFVDIDFYVTYQVTDPMAYTYATERPEEILRNVIQAAIRSTVSAYTVDSALTTGKSDIQQNIKTSVISELDSEKIGLSLVDIAIQDVEPPTSQIKEAFSEVENARQNKESALNKANQYRNEQLPAAEAKADKIIQKAEAQKTARINEASGQVARFNSEYAEYQKYPLITKHRMFYEAMEDLLPVMKIYIGGENGTQRLFLGNLDDAAGAQESEAKTEQPAGQ